VTAKGKETVLLKLPSEGFLPKLELCPSACVDDSSLTEATFCTMLRGRESWLTLAHKLVLLLIFCMESLEAAVAAAVSFEQV